MFFEKLDPARRRALRSRASGLAGGCHEHWPMQASSIKKGETLNDTAELTLNAMHPDLLVCASPNRCLFDLLAQKVN